MMKIQTIAGKKQAQQFADLMNTMERGEQKAFAEALCLQTHRTLQQSAFSTFMACIRTWAEMYEAGCYDLRNEETCRMSAEIVKLFGGDTYVPFI